MQPGRNLLHYRIVDKLGEGGMGVVWKAVDTTLGREVAIKVLPAVFSQDPERLARFEREARLLASLNHPNIATVHGLHEAEGVRFLAMELVEGEDLAARLERGRLPVDEALRFGVQIASALEAAHSQGVVHRDLKPANVVLTPDGRAKVLDFGLAKAVEPDAASASGSVSMSPTMTSAGSVSGMILGTAAYMSPEQARGKPVDRRADLWSFGGLLYECLTGVRLFAGETVSDSLAAILRKDPDWSALPADTPPMVRLALRRCLTRDPVKRLQDAGDLRLELEQAIEDPRGEFLGLAPAGAAAAERSGPLRWLPWAVSAVAVLAALVFGLRGAGDTAPGEAASRRLMIPVSGATEYGDDAASPPVISPDGRFVAFGVGEQSGKVRLWLRPLDDFEARPLSGTEGAQYAFWSPDSRHVGFFQGGKLKRIEVASGRVETIGGDGTANPRGGSWNAAGQLIYVPNSNAGIHLIDAAGAAPRQITTPDPDVTDASHRWPVFLPDGEHFLFLFWTNDLRSMEQHGGIYLGSLSGDEAPTRLLSDGSSVAYAPPGYLVLVRGENLVAIPFDARARKVTGEATVIASGVLRNRATGHGAFTVSTGGTLVYAGGQAFLPAALAWYDRNGNATPSGLEPAPYFEVRLAPDARRAAAAIPGPNGDGEIWILDLVRGVKTRLAYGSTAHANPVWSSDGERLMYAAQEKGSLDFYVRNADGSGEPELVLVDPQDKVLFDWSRDGRYAVYWPIGSGTGTPDLWLYSLERKAAELLIGGEPTYVEARFSPDTRWLAYVSDDSGRFEVFVQAFEDQGGVKAGARWQVSTAGGVAPHGRDDGREIVYWDLDNRVMAVSLEVQDRRLALGTPREMFSVDGQVVTADVTLDHERALVVSRDETASEPLRVILDWTAGL